PPHPPVSTLFPYTTLFRSDPPARVTATKDSVAATESVRVCDAVRRFVVWRHRSSAAPRRIKMFGCNRRDGPRRSECRLRLAGGEDRKSTRLNSSHSQISYA